MHFRDAAQTHRIGLIYPSNGSYEAEFQRFAPPDITLHFTRWAWPPASWFEPNWPDKLASLAQDPELARTARLFDPINPSVVTLACTSASFGRGAGGDAEVLTAIQRGTGALASSTSTGFLAACRALSIQRVAIASIYREDVTARFIEFLAQDGIESVRHRSAGWEKLPSKGSDLTEGDVLRFAESCDHAMAQAILIPETDLLASEAIPALETRLNKVLLSAAQVTIWHAARLAGSGWDKGIGRLWSNKPQDPLPLKPA